MLDQVLQVAILVSDMKKSFTFYSYVLGLTAMTRSERAVEFRTDGPVLAIKPRGQTPAGATTQVTFQVADVEVTFNEAKGRGAKVIAAPRTVEGGRTAQVADPDGNIIELFEPEA